MPKLCPNLLIDAHNLRRVYRQGSNRFTAVDSATFEVWEDEHIALVGRSGSGKSTLLSLIGGLDTPTAGTLSWVGLSSQATLRPAKVAFVFQMPSLLAPLTAVENVELPLLLENIPIATARTAALEALERLQLDTLAFKLPEELSGGQAQRVAVARALACRPKLILADEPTGHLDRSTAALLLDTLLGTLEDTDTALIIATHDPIVAERMDQLWVMQHGVLQTRPSTEERSLLPSNSKPKLSIVRTPPL